MEYPAIRGQSETGKHAVLFYRSTLNPNQCYKFQWKRSNNECLVYSCLGCKLAKNKGNSVTINSIKVSLDATQFLTNPEALDHRCIDLGFTFDYMASDVQQDLRLVLILKCLFCF